jgi:hypothetical protein
MKPYIEIFPAKGDRFFMHGPEDDDNCQYVTYGDLNEEFSVGVTDSVGNERRFTLEPSELGELLARAVTPNTKDLIPQLKGIEGFYDLVEPKELYFNEEGLDESATKSLFRGEVFTDRFYLRLVQARPLPTDLWCLHFVFRGKVITSKPTRWTEFTPRKPG